MQRTVLITGCSSGIGAAMAREFADRGHRVYATARRRQSLAPLEAAGVHGLELDVDDDESITRALDVVRQQVGHLDLLVNNAGFSRVGAVVDLTRDDLRRSPTRCAWNSRPSASKWFRSSRAGCARASASPPPRVIRGGANSVRVLLLKRLLPAAAFDAKLMKFFGLDALR